MTGSGSSRGLDMDERAELEMLRNLVSRMNLGSSDVAERGSLWE